MPTHAVDRWLLPKHQTEYPGHDVLHEATAHGRREATFLALAAIFLVATSAMVVLGTSRVVDLGVLIGLYAPSIEVPIALLLPLGVLAFAPSFTAGALVCELFGRRRASALVSVGFAATIALAGLMGAADLLDGGGAFGVAFALAATYLFAHVFNVIVFDALCRRARGRHLLLRLVATALFAPLVGWCAFALALDFAGTYIIAPVPRETIIALAAGSALATAACAIALAMPGALAGRALAVALRVGRDPFEVDDDEPSSEPAGPAVAEGGVARKLPPAVIVEDDEDEVQPFTSAEMRFFAEGEAL